MPVSGFAPGPEPSEHFALPINSRQDHARSSSKFSSEVDPAALPWGKPRSSIAARPSQIKTSRNVRRDLSADDARSDPSFLGKVPVNGRLEQLAARLEEGGLAAYLLDADWQLVWVSTGMQAILGESHAGRLGIGRHLLLNFRSSPWRDALTLESGRLWLSDHISLMLACEGDPDQLVEKVGHVVSDAAHRAAVEAIVKEKAGAPAPALLARPVQTTSWGEITMVTTAIRERSGELVGIVEIGWPHLPPPLAVLLVRGELEMFERMARLQEPSRREAAILFADLEHSGTLSRHLPSATYFELIRKLTSEIDRIVAQAGGVVGRHAGDGASAFFLADEAGSASLAATAVIEAARSLGDLGPRAAREIGIEDASARLNVGAHWGATLYMGQITGGRLEVTALGDEVNECARVQEAARGGSVLVTKNLLERLDDGDMRRLGIDPSTISYEALAEIEGVSEKAVRDAGGLAVTALTIRPSP